MMASLAELTDNPFVQNTIDSVALRDATDLPKTRIIVRPQNTPDNEPVKQNDSKLQNIIDQLFGLNGKERYQLWPEFTNRAFGSDLEIYKDGEKPANGLIDLAQQAHLLPSNKYNVFKDLSTFVKDPLTGIANDIRSVRRLAKGFADSIVSGVTAPHDAIQGKIPAYQIDENGNVRPSDEIIHRAMDMAGLAGSGGLAGAGSEAGVALGSAPFLRPALKYGEKLYKGKPGQQHMDVIPADLYPTFQKQAMSGEDISNFNFGFLNHKGQFLSREDALKYAIDNGLIDPHSAQYGALTSTLMSDTSKPGAVINALAKTNNPEWSVKGFENSNWFHGTTHDFDKFSIAKGNPENHLGKYPHFSSSSRDASANYAGHGPDLTSRIENRAEEIAQSITDKRYGGVMGDNYGKIMTEAKNKAIKELAGPHEGAVIPANLKLNNPISLVDSKPTWLDFTPKMNKDGDIVGDSALAVKFYNSLKKQGEKYNFNPDDVMASVGEHLYDTTRASDFDKALRNSEALMHVDDNKGRLVSSDIISNIYKDLGFDGIVMDAKAAFPHMKDIPEGTLHAAPLKRNTVQSKLTGKTLFSDTSKPGAALAAVANTNKPFYSAVENAVSAAKQPKADAQQWLSFLKNQPGVKQEELTHLGLDKLQGSISKDDLLKAVQEGQPQIKEVIKADKINIDPTVKYLHESMGPATKHLKTAADIADARRFNSSFRETTKGMSNEDVLKAARKSEEYEGIGDSKFHSYQLPGGENYREMLFTLPAKPQVQAYAIRYKDGPQMGEAYASKAEAEAALKEMFPNRKDLEIVPERATNDGVRTGSKPNPDDYKSSHWDEPNVLAHIRMNDRTIDGKKTLHLEEIQSDWHQAGRKHGYQQKEINPDEITLKKVQSTVPEGHDPSNYPGYWESFDKNGNLISRHRGNSTEAEAKAEAIKSAELNNKALIPDAPFKKTWDELALKKAITEAVKNGYDQISWTPGEAQAARYDLSKQVDSIKYLKNDDGTYNIVPFKNNSPVHSVEGENIKPEKLPDIVGKEVAEKIVKGDGNREAGTSDIRVLSGQDLKVGGQGMKVFYDKMLVDKMNALTKKYGGKVEQKDLASGKRKTLDEISNDLGFGGWHSNLTETQKSKIMSVFDEQKPQREGKTKVHVLKITPELREQVLKKGFPLFSAGVPVFTPVEGNPFEGNK